MQDLAISVKRLISSSILDDLFVNLDQIVPKLKFIHLIVGSSSSLTFILAPSLNLMKTCQPEGEDTVANELIF